MEDQDQPPEHIVNDKTTHSSESESEVKETHDTNSGSYESGSDDDQSHSGSGSEYSDDGSDYSEEGSDSESGSSSESEKEEDITYNKPLPTPVPKPRPPPGAPPPNVQRRSLRRSRVNEPRPPPGAPPSKASNRPQPPPGEPPKNASHRKSLRKLRAQTQPHPPPGAPPSSTQQRTPHPPATPPPQVKQPHPPVGPPPSQGSSNDTHSPHPPPGAPPKSSTTEPHHARHPSVSQPHPPSIPHPSTITQPHPPSGPLPTQAEPKEPHPPPAHSSTPSISHPPHQPPSSSSTSHTPSPSSQPQQPPPQGGSRVTVGQTAIAIFTFKAKGATFSNGEKDMDMAAQDVVKVLHDFGNGWIKVDLRGTVGLVPTTYVKPYTERASLTGPGPVTRAKITTAPAPKVAAQPGVRPVTPPAFQQHTDKQGLDPPRPSSPYNNVRKQHSLDSIALASKPNTVETSHLPLFRSTSAEVSEYKLEDTPAEPLSARPTVQRAWSSEDARPKTAVPEHQHHYTDPVDNPPVTRGPPPARRPLQSPAPTVLQDSPTLSRKPIESQGAPMPVSRGSMSRVTADTILIPQRISSPPPSRSNFAPPSGAKFAPPPGAKQGSQFSRSAPEAPQVVLDELFSDVSPSDVPPIISQTVEYLDNLALDSPGLFRESASATELKRLKQMFDSKTPVDLSDIRDPNLVAGLLKLYFRETSLPIFPNKLNKPFLDAIGIEDQEERTMRMKELFQEVPEPNFKILSFLFAHLRRVAAHQQVNKMTPANLGICWGPTLFRTGSQMTSVVQSIIELYQHLFL